MTGRKKGVSIGAAMKRRMDEEETNAGASEATLPTPTASPPQAPITAEADPLESFNTRLPRSLQRRLKIYVATHDTKIQDVLAKALGDYLERHED